MFRTAPALAAAMSVAAAAAIASAAAATALPEALGEEGGGGADAVLPPMDQLAEYLKRVVPPSSSASQWMADNANFLPQGYRDRLLAEHPSLAGSAGPAGQQQRGEGGASGSSSFSLPDPFDIFLGETFAYGRLRAASPGGAVVDQAGVTVCLVDRAPGGSLVGLANPETGKAACSETDRLGRYAGHIFTDGDHGNPVDLWLNISAAGAAGAVVNGNGSAYAAMVDVSDDLDEPLTRLGDTTMGEADGIRRAFWILDAVSLGREAVLNATGSAVPRLDIAWPNDTRSRERTSYDHEAMSMSVSSAVRRGMSHGAEAYPASILHEYGHHALRSVYPDAAPPASGGSACTAPIGRTASPACAWSEGWAHFFPAAVLGGPQLQYHGQRYPADLEAARWNVRSPSLSFAFATGSAGQVAAALWDLHDPAGEPGDTVANKTAAVWGALRYTKAEDGQGGGAGGAAFGDFAGAWGRAASNPPLSSVMVLNGLATVRSLLAGEPAAPLFSDSFESGAGSWVMTGEGNWDVAPDAGRNGSAALHSSGCAAPRGCEATALAAVNASSGHMRATFSLLLDGGNASSLALQRSDDGLAWSDAASYNGSVRGWRDAAVDAMRATGNGTVHFRLAAISPLPSMSAAVDDFAVRADAAPAVSPVPDVYVGRHNRSLDVAVRASDPDGDAVSLALALSGGAGGASVALSDLGNGTGVLGVRAGPADAGSVAAVITASAHGLSGSERLVIRVGDVMAPAISGDTTDRTVEASRAGATPVPLGAVGATDNHDPSPAITHNRSSSGAYPLGSTTVVYAATDASGNSAAARQTIRVVDTTPPALEGVPSDVTAHRQRWIAPAVAVVYAAPTAKDLGVDVPVTCTPPPGSEFALGATVVTCAADDGRGNSASAQFTVTVAEPPILRSPSSPAPVSPPGPLPAASPYMPNLRGIDVAEIGGSTYAVIAHSYPVWWYLDGVRIVNITDPYNPSLASDAFDGRGGFGRLGGAMDVAVAEVGGGTYAAAVSLSDGAIQIVNITDPAAPSASAALSISASGTQRTPGSGAGIAAFGAGSSTYVIAAAPRWGGGGIHIANITSPASPALVATAADGAAGFDELAGASAVAVAEIGGSTYAVVAAPADSGVQIINITSPASPVAVSSATDGAAGFDRLDGASGVAVAGLGASTYAIVASPGFPTDSSWYVGGHLGGGVQIINITSPASPVAVSSATDGAAGFVGLYTANGVATAVLGQSLYALVTSFYDDGLQVVGVEAAGPNLPPRLEPIPDSTVVETGRLRHDVLASDPNGDRLTIAASSVPPAPGLGVSDGNRLEWTPNASQSGTYNVTVTATDGHGASASDSFTLTVRDASVRSLAHSTFASSLDGWSYRQVGQARAIAQYCWGSTTVDTVTYTLSRSSERGGSAHVNYANNWCWFGNVGAARNVTVPASHDGGDIRISLDYRSRGTIYKTGDGTNNAFVMVSDSRGRVPLLGPLYSNERVPGAGDTGWRSATEYARSIDSSACPCTVFVFLYDSWQMQHRQNLFVDNIRVSVAKAAGAGASGAGGASGSSAAAAPAHSSLTVDEVFAMLGSNATSVLITEKIVDGTSVSLAWSARGWGGGPYDVSIAAAGGGGPEAGVLQAAHTVRGTEHRFDGLAPHTEYEIRVGVRGDPATQSVVHATTSVATP